MTEQALVGFIDARCGCDRCETRTGNVYRMVGRCSNCTLEPLLILYRAGDKASPQDCPGCGNRSVSPFRRATPDEIPAAVVGVSQENPEATG